MQKLAIFVSSIFQTVILKKLSWNNFEFSYLLNQPTNTRYEAFYLSEDEPYFHVGYSTNMEIVTPPHDSALVA